jgi:5-methylcytosine-specific restriction endonuclease McrA
MPRRTPDLSGQRFGARLVLSRAGYERGRLYWNVRCNCGRKFKCLSQALYHRSKRCRMCGHKGPRPYRRKRPFESNYNSLVQRARYPVLITYEQFVEFTKTKECHYCGEDIFWPEYRIKGQGGTATNLDRKDNSKPYELENIVIACRRCNYSKNDHFTYEEWMQIGKLIRSWRTK